MNAAFCLACGEATQGDVAPASRTRNIRRPNRGPWLLGFLISVTFLVVAFAVKNALHTGADESSASRSSAAPIEQAVMVPHTQKLLSGSTAVNRHSIFSIPFLVNPSMRDVTISGHFQAYGGARNDIQAVICSEDDFVNFRNGHEARVLYDSGKTTVGDISVNVPNDGRRYILVFSNAFSPFSGKTVVGEVTLNYSMLGH